MRAGQASVSVIIPAFNRRDFLREALRSVFDQTSPPLEVLVVDDGSTDGTAATVESEFPAARILSQPNQGPSAARNLGIRSARGEWLAFLDSDDLWHPRKLERQVAELARRPRYRIAYTDEIWIRRGVRVNPGKVHRKYSGWIFHRCLPLCIISPSSVIIHREIFEEAGRFDEALPVCEDYDLWLRLGARYPIYFQEEKLITKRGGHPDQLSNREWGNDRFRIAALRKILDDTTGWFSADHKRQAREWLQVKCAILAQGCRKRGKEAEARHYEALAARN